MKGIIMSGDSVKAILEGRKTQTRRLIKDIGPYIPEGKYRYDGKLCGVHAIELLDENGKPTEHYIDCESPRYFPGDIVYVKETWGLSWEMTGGVIYKADYTNGDALLAEGEKWRKAMFMPQDAARIFLRIIDLRVERLHDITPGDVWDEGVRISSATLAFNREAYLNLFYKINKGIAPGANPLVWVYAFERVDRPEGAV